MNNSYAENDIEYIILTEEQIKKRIKELGQELTEMYKGAVPILGCVLKGASVFYTDLIKEFNGPMLMDFISVRSYNCTESTGAIEFRKGFDNDITGKDIVLVEDIIDTGYTLKYLKDLLYDRKAKSVRTVALLDKKARRAVDMSCDLIGFPVEDKFVVGYGLDYNGKYRNLPFIGVLKKEIYENKAKN